MDLRRTESSTGKRAKTATKLISESRSNLYFNKIEGCGNDHKMKRSAIKEVLHPPSSTIIRTPEEIVMAQSLVGYFIDKVARIKSVIGQHLGGLPPEPIRADSSFTGKELSGLLPVSQDEVKKIIDSMVSKSSPQDFISTSLLKDCCEDFSCVIARLANLSFAEGSFPSRFKIAK